MAVMTVKSSVKISFDCDAALADDLRQTAFDLDVPKSSLIRFCLQLGLICVQQHPTMLQNTTDKP